MMTAEVSANPFRAGNGFQPLCLAGRAREQEQFSRLLDTDTVPQNVAVLGLRGTGKTVLLERFKSIAQDKGWFWAGSDLSE